jgi:hypothetical protein
MFPYLPMLKHAVDPVYRGLNPILDKKKAPVEPPGPILGGGTARHVADRHAITLRHTPSWRIDSGRLGDGPAEIVGETNDRFCNSRR